MKKIISLFSAFLFILLFVSSCSCKKNDKVSLSVGDVNATNFIELSMAELDSKIKAKDNFILFVYSDDCDACTFFKPILASVIQQRDLIVYGIQFVNVESGHELKSIRWTPSIVIYDSGKLTVNVNLDDDYDYFKNNNGFNSFLDDYTYMPTMYYINKEQLVAKIDNDESFIIYYSRNDCGDCKYMYENYLKEFLKDNPNAKKIYVIETNVEGIRLVDGVLNNENWQSFKDEFGLSEAGNSTFGHGVGYVPTIQYYNQGELSDMLVYFNDYDEIIRNPDNSVSFVIDNSYYDDNPYIGQTISMGEYKEKLASFYNGKLTTFINNYLGLVD